MKSLRRKRSVRTRRRRRGGTEEEPPMIIRFRLEGCGACNMSQNAWDTFAKTSPIKPVEIEQSAIPPQWNDEVKAFPTYIVVVDGKKVVAKKQGAITDPANLKKLAKKARKS